MAAEHVLALGRGDKQGAAAFGQGLNRLLRAGELEVAEAVVTARWQPSRRAAYWLVGSPLGANPPGRPRPNSDTGGEFDVRRMFRSEPPRINPDGAVQASLGAAPTGYRLARMS
jgi:hypothetical protein